MSDNAKIVIAQALMMRIKDYAERSLDKKDVTLIWLWLKYAIQLTLMTSIFRQEENNSN